MCVVTQLIYCRNHRLCKNNHKQSGNKKKIRAVIYSELFWRGYLTFGIDGARLGHSTTQNSLFFPSATLFQVMGKLPAETNPLDPCKTAKHEGKMANVRFFSAHSVV